ncbi:acyl-CoA thioester hydrolase [Flavobacteriaceae bacterium MAR_2010_105]|nr:acyl-CoA thioester hydrolase [Flavobacteriaceae bacterium MAR_2010_105]
MQVLETTLKVTKNHLDAIHHVNNVQYVQWVQDVAEKHWNSKATPEILNSYFWVLLSHHIQYKGQAVLDDVLTLKTFVTKSEGVTSTRTVEIYNYASGKLLTTSETNWCLMSRATLKPSRITQEIIDLFH